MFSCKDFNYYVTCFNIFFLKFWKTVLRLLRYLYDKYISVPKCYKAADNRK